MALKIIFMGTSEFSVPILKSLYYSEHNILEVYTQAPRKKNRGQKIEISPIHKFSLKNKITVRYPDKINAKEEVEHIKQVKPDIVIVVAYGKILPKKLLNIKDLKFINIHASLLPKWRGAAPIHRAIMNLDKETGISIMQIEAGLDTGPIMMSAKIKILKNTNYKNLSNQLSKMGSELILKSLKLIENKEEKFIKQNNQDATYAKKIEKTEAKINWNETGEKIIAKINALHQNPGCWFELDGSRIKITKAVEINKRGSPGQILENNLTIACGEKAIQILELTKEGKQNMSASEFLLGHKVQLGKIL